MKTRWLSLIGMLTGTVVAVSCSSSTGGTGTDTLDKWRGSTPHLRVEGQLKGEKISINLTGAQASDVLNLRCRREYFADSNDAGVLNAATAIPSEVKIIWVISDDGGVVNSAQLEFKRHDFRSNKEGDKVTAIPRNDTMLPTGQNFWLEYQKNDPDGGVKLLEYGAQSGTYTHGTYDCPRDAAKPAVCQAAMGTMGGFVTGVWSDTDKLSASWTANCNTDRLEAKP